MAKPGVMFYFDVRPCIKRLNINEKGRLFEAILDYGEFGIVPDLDGALGVAWDFIQPKLDRDAERYDKQVEQKQYAAYVREAKRRGQTPLSFDDWKAIPDTERYRVISGDTEKHPTTTSTPNLQPQSATPISTDNIIGADKPPSRHRFTPPTVDEVEAYCTEKGYNVDPDRFVDFYTSIGWKVGKNPMKDWKAMVRNWSRKERPNEKAESKPLWTVGTTV